MDKPKPEGGAEMVLEENKIENSAGGCVYCHCGSDKMLVPSATPTSVLKHAADVDEQVEGHEEQRNADEAE